MNLGVMYSHRTLISATYLENNLLTISKAHSYAVTGSSVTA
jgi:hypothetical protein